VKLSHCRSCGEPIIWTITTNGKRMPVDADPVVAPRGFRIDETQLDSAQMGFNDDDLKPGKDVLALFTGEPYPGELLYISHFQSCPQATQWRKP
jgi:hypothetical protein